MESLVVLRILQETLTPLAISQDGLRGELQTSKDLRNVIYRAALEYAPKDEEWTIKNAARLRYRINPRAEQYIRQLSAPLDDKGVSIYMDKPCLVGLARRYPRSVFGEEATQVDVAQHLYDELVGSTVLLGTISRVVNLCARLPARGGTRQYRELLPSRLAALTVCGMDGAYH
jgi:hypothetical protein